MKTCRCPRLLLAVCLFALSAVAAAQNAVITESTDVYAGPDDSYPVVAQVDVDTPIEVNGCLGDWSWCDVSFEDDHGWIYAPDVIYGYEGGYVPLYTYAPALGIPVVEFTIVGYWDRYYHDRPWFARRDEWMHRDPREHRRPPGPAPTASPPPRTAFVEPPHRGPNGSFRLGRAEPGRAEPPREGPPPSRDNREGAAGRAEPPRASEHMQPPRPEERPEAPRAPDRGPPRAAEHEQPPHAPPEPPHMTERPGTAQHEESAPPRPESQRRDERERKAGPGGLRPEERPHQEPHQDRPQGENPQ